MTWIFTCPMSARCATAARTSVSALTSRRWARPGSVRPSRPSRRRRSAARRSCCPDSRPSASRRATRSASPSKRSSTTVCWSSASPTGSGDRRCRSSRPRTLRTKRCSNVCWPTPDPTTSPRAMPRHPSSCRPPASWATIPTMRSPSVPTRRSIRRTTCAASSSRSSCAARSSRSGSTARSCAT